MLNLAFGNTDITVNHLFAFRYVYYSTLFFICGGIFWTVRGWHSAVLKASRCWDCDIGGLVRERDSQKKGIIKSECFEQFRHQKPKAQQRARRYSPCSLFRLAVYVIRRSSRGFLPRYMRLCLCRALHNKMWSYFFPPFVFIRDVVFAFCNSSISHRLLQTTYRSLPIEKFFYSKKTRPVYFVFPGFYSYGEHHIPQQFL